MSQNKAPSKASVFLRRCFMIACGGYTCLSLLILAGFLLLIYPGLEKPLSEVLLGGIPVIRHFILFGVSLSAGILYAVIRVKKEPKQPKSSLPGYFRRVFTWYTVFMASDILCYGFYLDTLYNEYDPTEAVLLRGPAFILSVLFLVLSLLLPFLNLLVRHGGKHRFLRVLLHLFLLIAVIGLLFQVAVNGFGSPKNYLIFCSIFAGVYAFGCLMVYCLHGAQAKDDNEQLEYTDLYMTDDIRRQRAEDAARDEKRRSKAKRK